MQKAGALLLPLALALALIGSVVAGPRSPGGLLEGYRSDRASFGAIYSRGGSLSSRSDLAGFVESRLLVVESRLGRRLEEPITLVLVPDRREFERLFVAIADRAPSKWMLGVAFPDRRWAIVREDDIWIGYSKSGGPHATLDHELAHLVIHRRGRPVPRWLDEGLAMRASQSGLSHQDEARLSGLARVGGLFDLRELRFAFPSHHHTGSIAYQQSFLLVSFIAERYGESALAELLERLEEGESVDVAWSAISGESTMALERTFRAWLAERHSILAVLATFVNFWTLVTMLAIVAMTLGAVRRRRLMRKLAAEDLEADAGGGEDGRSTETLC